MGAYANPPASDPPLSTPSTRVFLSYARGDDEPFVKRLDADLTKEGFNAWFDRESLMARGLSFRQEIKAAIRTEADRVALALCGGMARKRGGDFHSVNKALWKDQPSTR